MADKPVVLKVGRDDPVLAALLRRPRLGAIVGGKLTCSACAALAPRASRREDITIASDRIAICERCGGLF